jgi:hypothetical protein
MSGGRKERREMKHFWAVRVGQKISEKYLKMDKAICPECGAHFSIAHLKTNANAKLVKAQITKAQRIIRDEHVDDKFEQHLKVYKITENRK